jgi:hypothetical protein
MTAPGVREEATVLLRYKANGSAVMTDTSLVRARGVRSATVVSPLLSIPAPQADPAFTKELLMPVMKSAFVISVP